MTSAEKTQSAWKIITKGYVWIAMVGGALGVLLFIFQLIIGIITLVQTVEMAKLDQDM